MSNMDFYYGMKYRGFAPMCQPKEGFVERQDDWTGGNYWDILVYNRELTAQECRDYDLVYIGMERSRRHG